MAVRRTGQPVLLSDIRQKLKDFGTCLKFDGATGYVTSGNGNAFGDSFYVSFWMKWYGTTGTWQQIINKRDSYSASTMMLSMSLKNTTGEIYMDSYNGNFSSGYVPPIGEWIHVCWVHDKVKNYDSVYVNCQREYDVAIKTLGTGTTSELVIGAVDTPKKEFFNGEIDEFVIGIGNPTWKDVVAIKSKFKYTSDANSEGIFSPYIYYKFDEGSGISATDSSGNAITGTITNATYSSNVAIKSR